MKENSIEFLLSCESKAEARNIDIHKVLFGWRRHVFFIETFSIQNVCIENHSISFALEKLTRDSFNQFKSQLSHSLDTDRRTNVMECVALRG